MNEQIKDNKQNEEQVYKSLQIHELEYPFVAVEQDGIFKIAAGDSIMSKNEFSTLDECLEYVKSKPYELIINITCYCMENSSKHETK